MRQLIPPTKNKFQFKRVTDSQIIKLINKLPNWNCKGHDQVAYKINKTIKHEIAPIITHLINRIIITYIFPDIFKISRILLLLKPDKLSNLIDSYWPKNILVAVKKLLRITCRLKLINCKCLFSSSIKTHLQINTGEYFS